MVCLICGSDHVEASRVDIDGSSLGLPAGLLVGVDRISCNDCGEVIDSLPAQGAVIKEYRLQLAHLGRRLTGEEFAFLRRTLGMSGSQYADLVGVSNVTISRVEHGEDVTAMQDALIRGVTMLDVHTPDGLTQFARRERASVEVNVPDVVRRQPRELTNGWQDFDHGVAARLPSNVIRFPARARLVSHTPAQAFSQSVSFEAEIDRPLVAACGNC